jgi:purine-cytosine permease-like protein
MMIFFAQWLAANMAVSSFAIGALATPVFFLGFLDSILAILFFNILGILPVAFFSTFGPVFGLRQMVLSRFFFGYYGVKISASSSFDLFLVLTIVIYIVAVLNILACIGWSCVNTIVGAQLINAVNTNLPGFAGVLIIAAATFIISLFGYKVVHAYEFWSWIPSFIVFLIVLGEFAHSGVSSRCQL